jgi:phenylalanyl-tRNA synthetase beta chain
MYISKNWLKDFVKIPDSLSAKDLALKLTMAVAEVEGFSDQKEKLKGVVVGEILEINKHPNADKLQLTVVDVGTEKLNIVCGAPNIAKGQKVPVATIGTILPNGLKIEKAKVRGEESFGMLCAEDELGLGSDHSGILILDKKLVPGTSLSTALDLDDVVFEIENKTLTHRPDLWSHYGLAREIAAILGEKLNKYEPKPIKAGKEKLDIKIEDYSLCPRYMGVVLEKIVIKDSPAWLKKRLEAVGMRAINNVVDVTNYVMMEIGQPLHAFDYDKLEGHRIVVRLAKPGEKIVTLDNQVRKLNEENLVIADGVKPVAIAGVMGGANTEIDNQTQKIIIESANFDHVSIRQTQSQLGLRTEASIRFEKSLDPHITEFGLKKAVELILQLCPEAKVISPVEDVKKFKLNQGPIRLTFDFLNKKIGQIIDPKKVISILESLGFAVAKEKDSLEVTVPTWRATKDIAIPEDIVEEVARIFGFDNLKLDMPLIKMARPEVNLERELERRIKNILATGFAFTEVYNYSFVSEEHLKKIGLQVEDHIKILNPQAKEWNLLRSDLVTNLLDNIRLNSRFYDEIRLFEIGSVYLKDKKGEKISDKREGFLPSQPKWLTALVSKKNTEQLFYETKNIMEGLLKQLRFSYTIKKAEQVMPWARLDRSLLIMIDTEIVGLVSEVNPKVAKNYDLKNKIGILALDLSALTQHYKDEMAYKPIPKFPSIDLDISLIIDKNTLWQEIKEAVGQVEKDLIRQVTVFDVFEGKNIPAGKKSLAFRIEYRSDDKTLTMDEVQIIHNKVLQVLESKFKSQIRK